MYEFTEDCMIHIEEIDNEHRRLFQMVNEAIDLANWFSSPKSRTLVNGVLDKFAKSL